MNMKKVYTAISVFFVLLACEDNRQSNTVQTPLPLQVLALDPELAGAIVYEDTNGDGILNAGENYAFTDADGYVTNNPNTAVNYCEISTDNRHCFRLLFSKSIIRVVKGYDVRSKGQNRLQMSLSYTATSNDLNSVVVSPLSSVPSLEAAVDANFVELSSTTDRTNYATALKLYSAVAVISELLSARYPNIGEKSNLPADFGVYVYKAVDNLLKNQTISDINRLSSIDVKNIINASIGIIDTAYQNAGYTTTVVLDSDKVNRISENIEVLSNIVTTLTASTNKNQVIIATPQIIEALVVKAAANNTSTFKSNVDFVAEGRVITGMTNTSLVALLSVESNLANNFILAREDFASLTRDDILLADIAKFLNLANKRLILSTNADGVDARIIIDFTANSANNTGDINICIRYRDSNGVKQLETSGSHLRGGWVMQTANQLVAYIAFADIEFSIRVIRNSATKYQLDYGGQLRQWNVAGSANGDFLDSPSVLSTSNATCTQTL